MIAAISRSATTILGMLAMARATRPPLRLEPLDLLPQCAVLLLVGRPDLLLRDLAEGLDVALDHGHALGLKLLLRGLEIVDRFGELAALVLRLARGVEHQLLVRRRQPF